MTDDSERRQTATLAGGCFWCTEAVFQRLRGVDIVVPGYTGGTVPDPTYDEVCSGETGHAEAVQITFDPRQVSFRDLLEVFFHLHDPTTLNYQGADYGTQYRSAVYYHDDAQKAEAGAVIEEIDASGLYPRKVVTEVAPASRFYPAESDHRDFYDRNRGFPYCRVVIDPKIRKLFREFAARLK